jgi:hypothetical protein
MTITANLNLPKDINAYIYSNQPMHYIIDKFIGIIIDIDTLQQSIASYR